MYLRNLSLRQFRNYTRLELDFSPGLNIFVGPNGSGKSNLMEAVAVLTTGQSHRGAEPKHLIQQSKEGFALKGSFDGEETVSLETRQMRNRPRQTLLDNVPQKRLRGWVGRVPVVSFSPDDLDIVKGEPAVRRRLLNAALCQVDLDYMETLQRYMKVLAERNAALRQIQEREQVPAVLEPWDGALLKEGLSLTLARRRFLAELEPLVRARLAALCAAEGLSLSYKPSLLLPEGDEEGILAANRQRLKDLREGEIALGITLSGPHRDELDFVLNGAPARAYASQGQQRTIALSLKLAEREFLLRRLGRRPVCLLDDMFSELDPARRENLVGALASESQCLVSLAALADWPQAAWSAAARVFQVREGACESEPASA